MRVISNKALVDFASIHAEADTPLQAWRRIIETGSFGTYADLKSSFHAVDKVSVYYIFNIGGNKFRLVAAIHFDKQNLFIRHVFTHQEYDEWKP